MNQEDLIQRAPELLVQLSSKDKGSVYSADIALADAMEAWKRQRLLTRLAKAATYKQHRSEGKSQVDAQAESREENKSLSEEEIIKEANYYKTKAERDQRNNFLITVRQVARFHNAAQD